MNKPCLIMMSGLPGSGKSSISQELSEEYSANIHSSDSIRSELFDDENVQDKNDVVFHELHKRVISDLVHNCNTIYDACNINYKQRMSFLQLLKQNNIECKKIIYIIATPYEECLNNNNNRTRIVPEYVIKRMYMNYYIPYYYEGWDEIRIQYNTLNYNMSIEKLFTDSATGLDIISQDNPHHLYTIGYHCRETVAELWAYANNISDIVIYEAALLHDIGKAFTKNYVDHKGNKTEIAHYYQHHIVSAYNSLFYEDYFNDRLLRAIYIQWHMQPFFITNNKAENKYHNLWGDKIYHHINLLHQADLIASGTSNIGEEEI